MGTDRARIGLRLAATALVAGSVLTSCATVMEPSAGAGAPSSAPIASAPEPAAAPGSTAVEPASPSRSQPEPALVTATVVGAPFAVSARAVTIDPSIIQGGPLTFVSGFELRSGDPRFGGLSGATLMGDRLWTIGDRGRFFAFDLTRDPSGRITDVRGAVSDALRDAARQPLRGRSIDAEALAVGVDGRRWVAFEQAHRVVGYDALGDEAVIERAIPHVEMPRNGGFEAAAIDARGALWLFAEHPLGGTPGLLSGWRLDASGAIQSFTVSQLENYAATGADIGPDGALYLLERRFSFWTGIHMRIRRFSPSLLAQVATGGDGVDLGEGEVLGWLGGVDAIDNMEAIAVERAPQVGGVLITALSDDNFNRAQRTLLLQFRAPIGP